jgi:hypothetical protein
LRFLINIFLFTPEIFASSVPLRMVQDDGAVARLLPADCLAIEEIGAAGREKLEYAELILSIFFGFNGI